MWFLLCFIVHFVGGTDIDLHEASAMEIRGYYKRENSLTRPYQSSGMDIPYWDIIGSTIVTPQQIRLTSDAASRKGGLWNRLPVVSRDWELQVSFKVSGSTGDLFGDGMAVWYTQERGVLGEVFGSKDYFRGLGVFLDTYSNHNGVHTHGHPYVSAMVNNGSAHYDHDRDGTHTQLGGEHTGCEAKFRNKNHDTNLMIRYVGDTLSIYIDIHNEQKWKKCMSVDGVRLPLGYYIGITAATGELADNHDVIAVKLFEEEFSRAEQLHDVDRRNIDPAAEFVAAPRDHAEDPKPSKLGAFGTFILVVIGIVVCVFVVGFGVVFLQKRQANNRKRFY